MASLTNTKIKDTYDGLLKTTDNDALGGTYKLITDGLGNSSGLYLGTGGRLGLGTSSPSSKLHVDSGVSETSDWGNLGIISDFPINNTGRIYTSYLLQDSESIKGAGIGLAYDGTGYRMHFGTASTTSSGLSTAMTIDSSGRVGIGTSSPSSLLNIKGSNGQFLIQNGGSANQMRISSFNNAGNADGAIIFEGYTKEYARIDTSGNLGLGTSSPSAALTVQANSQAQGVFKGWSTTGANAASGAIRLGDNSSYQGRIDYAADGNTEFMFDNTYASGIYTFSIAGSEKLRLDSSGRLGIGTTSPGEKLDVSGTIRSSANEGKLVLNSTATNGKEYQFISIDSGNLGLFDGTAYRLWVAGSGNVGVGTTSPLSKTHIDFTADFDGLRIQNSNRGHNYLMTTAGGSAEFFSLYDLDNNNNLALFGNDASVFYTTGTERMRIDSSGVVTIKNDLLLDNGVGRFTFQNASGVNDVYSTTTGFGAYEDLRISADNYIFRTGTTERMRLDSSGNVLINRTGASGLGKLNVEGGADFTGGNVLLCRDTGAVGIGTSSPTAKLEVKGSGTSPIVYFGNGVDNAPNRQLAFSGGSSGLVYDLDATGASGVGGQLTLSTNGSERMRIDSEGAVSVYNDFTIDNGSPEMYFKTGSSHYSWMVAAQENVDAGLEITPSTTVSSGTYSSPVAVFKATGEVGIGVSNPGAKLEVRGSGDGDLFIGRHSSNASKLIYGYQSASDGFLELRSAGDITVSKISGYVNTPSYFKSRVGIGTTSITNSRLQIKGANNTTNAYSDGLKVTSNNETVFTQYNWNGINGDTVLSFATGGTERMQIASDGGIFAYNLLASTSVSNPQIRLNISTKELYYQSSSLRYKEEVENLDSQIDNLMNLRTVKFKVKGTNEDATGLIAEEVAEVIPELTFKNEVEGFDEPQIDGVSYGDLPTYLLKAIQEQQEMINELKSEIQTLKSQINS